MQQYLALLKWSKKSKGNKFAIVHILYNIDTKLKNKTKYEEGYT
jgi:hypothetical protein